ncbi:hypothetical protein SAMN05216226_11112 [Halovenus aranensis]|jgi:hypothetical protein|uniref:RecA-superfamily ATPase, KaiC/GvpD/RAD55 family n=1 Tax=Halovenus aranensis TaxID=890420 RepID=A0A1G8XDF3_9EURY|nr:hypothetical protein [Halovenus aranensis]SDJ88501.1 hypothetical protein SAMN05216226_11112 [Halovenus aranensis]
MAERAGQGDDTLDLSGLDAVSNVLLLVPSLGNQGRQACLTLLSRTPPSETNVLTVTYTDTAPDWVDLWSDNVGTPPVRGGIVPIGQGETDVDDPSWAVKSVENPSDLTGIGIQLSELLSTMAKAADDSEEIAICFDSVTSLLQYADLQRAFRFLHVVTGRVKTVDGVGYYRLDPDAHDRQTLATLKGLFDAVVEVDEDGNWSVQT